jgi:WD40 repeat protein
VTDQAPDGGAPQVEAISADNLDRLSTLVQLPLPAFMTSLKFSPDSKLLAVGTAKGGAVFNLETKQQIATFAQDTPLFGLAWSPDSKLIVGVPGAFANGKLAIWDVTSNAESDLLKDKLAGQTAFAFSQDGTQAASGGQSGDVTLWNLSSGEAVGSFNVTEAGADTSAGQPKVSSLTYAGDGKTLIVGSVGAVDETLLWDLSTGKSLTKPSPANHIAGPVATALFAPGDMNHIYWWSRGEVVVVDLTSDQETGRLSTEDIIQSAAFSPDGALLAVGAAGTVDGTISPLVKLWSTVTGQDVKVLTGLTQIPTAMAFSPDGSLLALGIGGEGIAVWGLVQNQ